MPQWIVKNMIIFLSDEGYGWTEIHYSTLTQDAIPNMNGPLNSLEALILAPRRALLGSDCSIVGTRCSVKTPLGIASLNRIYTMAGDPANVSTSQNDSLAMQMIDGSGTRKKIVHIRGFPAACVSAEGYDNTALGGAFDKALRKYQIVLINNGYGWYGKNNATSVFGTVNGYTQNAIDQIVFTVTTAPGSALFTTLVPPVGNQSYQVSISRVNQSRSTLNRTWVVQASVSSTPANLLTTINPIGAGAFISEGRFIVRVPNFISYALGGLTTLGERRMGRPLGHYPGRRLRRPTI